MTTLATSGNYVLTYTEEYGNPRFEVTYQGRLSLKTSDEDIATAFFVEVSASAHRAEFDRAGDN